MEHYKVLLISPFQGIVDMEALVLHLNVFHMEMQNYALSLRLRRTDGIVMVGQQTAGYDLGLVRRWAFQRNYTQYIGTLKFNRKQKVLSSDQSFSSRKHGRNALLPQSLALTCRKRSDDREKPRCAARVSMVFRILVIPDR